MSLFLESEKSKGITNRLMEEKKAQGATHISFSEFSLYNECPFKHLVFKYLVLDQEPPSIHLFFGSAIHAAIENSFIKNWGIQKRVAHFKEYFTKEMKENKDEVDGYEDFELFLEQGEAILNALDLTNLIENYELVAVEEPLYEHIYGDFYFKGFIDLVVKHKKTGRYLIIDWKTATEPWKLKWKLQNFIFLCQMRFYKYFYGRKHNIDLENIDTKYMVLCRFYDKKNPQKGYGKIEEVEMTSSFDEVKLSLEKLAETVRGIHIEQNFAKAKILEGNSKPCIFCKYKNESSPMCNKSPDQHKAFLKENYRDIL